jgi:hypothetical protein
MSRYIISVKYGFRDRVPAGLRSELEQIEGLAIVGDSNPYRIQAEASEAAIAQARRLLGGTCHIEPLIPHVPQAVAG